MLLEEIACRFLHAVPSGACALVRRVMRARRETVIGVKTQHSLASAMRKGPSHPNPLPNEQGSQLRDPSRSVLWLFLFAPRSEPPSVSRQDVRVVLYLTRDFFKSYAKAALNDRYRFITRTMASTAAC
jgi:hypothetical protein